MHFRIQKPKFQKLKETWSWSTTQRKSRLETERLLWDQKTAYFYSEKAFVLTTPTSIVRGIGFECKEDLSKHLAKNVIGDIETNEE